MSRQREEQIRHPDRHRARGAVARAIEAGRIAAAYTKRCSDCGESAIEYDHHLGYEREQWLDVEPVCRRCHYFREMERRTECRNGHPRTPENLYRLANNTVGCRACDRVNGGKAGELRRARTGARRIPRDRRGVATASVGYSLSLDERLAVERLVAAGYAPNKSACVGRAVSEAAARL